MIAMLRRSVLLPPGSGNRLGNTRERWCASSVKDGKFMAVLSSGLQLGDRRSPSGSRLAGFIHLKNRLNENKVALIF